MSEGAPIVDTTNISKEVPTETPDKEKRPDSAEQLDEEDRIEDDDGVDDVPREIKTKSPPQGVDEHRHTIGGKRFSITPLQSNLLLDIGDHLSDASLSMSEEGEENHEDTSESEEGGGSVKSNLTDEESYAVSTSGSEDGEYSSPNRLPFSTYAPSPSHSEASFDVTKDLVTDLSPSSAMRYAAKTPKVADVTKKKKERRKRRKAKLKKENERRERAAIIIQRSLLPIRRARIIAKFLRENPNVKNSEKQIVRIQSLLRGNSDRRKVKVLTGDYVPNAGLEILKGQHNGERGLCEYVRKLEEENRQLLLDLANVNSMNLLTGPAKKAKANADDTLASSLPLSKNRRRRGKSKRWLLYKLDSESGAYVEVKLGYAGLRRLDVIAEQNSVRKIEKEEEKKLRDKRREEETMEAEAAARADEDSFKKKEISPMEEVEAIEGRRGIEGDIDFEEEEEKEGGENVEKAERRADVDANPEPVTESEPVADGPDVESEPQSEHTAESAPEPAPEPEDDINEAIISAPDPHLPPPKSNEEIDVVLQWRQSRGYGLGDSHSGTQRKKSKKKKKSIRF